jgi:hypothetical protein
MQTQLNVIPGTIQPNDSQMPRVSIRIATKLVELDFDRFVKTENHGFS